MRTILLLAAMLVVGIAVTILRLPADARNILWAEDGSVFLTDAYRHPLFENLFAPYAGYMHLIPRLSAQLVAAVAPASHLGLAMNLCGAAVWSTVALAAFVFTRDRLTMWLRALLWVLVLLIPLGSHEVATNTANSHWFLMFGLFWAVASRSSGRGRTFFACLLAVAAVLSDPLSLVFAPFVVLRVLTLRGLREQAVSIAYVAAAAVQLLVVLGTERDRGEPVVDPGGLGYLYLIRVVWSTLVGPDWGSVLYFTFTAATTAVIAGVLLAVVVVGVALRFRRSGLPTAALATSIVFFVAVAVLTWQNSAWPPVGQGVDVYWGGRYWVLPTLLFVTAIVSAADAWLAPLLGRRARAPRVAFAALAVLLAAALLTPGISNYRTPAYKARSTQMSTGLAQDEVFCERYPSATTRVPVAPSGQYLWIPCEKVIEP